MLTESFIMVQVYFSNFYELLKIERFLDNFMRGSKGKLIGIAKTDFKP